MIALVDSDIVAYRCAASAEGEEPGIALARVDELMERILFNTNADSYRAFIGGKDNFRYKYNPQYKANRTQPKPIHLQACRDWLVSEWKAEIVNGMEADDALGINQTTETVICSIDKDLRQIPGQHFNFVKLDWTEVDEYTSHYNLYRQFIEGDKSDNIIGMYGMGPKRAEKELYGLHPDEMFNRVRELYQDDKRMLMNGHCLYIWRKENDVWPYSRELGQVAESCSNENSLEKQNFTEPTTIKIEDGFLVNGTRTEPFEEQINHVV